MAHFSQTNHTKLHRSNLSNPCWSNGFTPMWTWWHDTTLTKIFAYTQLILSLYLSISLSNSLSLCSSQSTKWEYNGHRNRSQWIYDLSFSYKFPCEFTKDWPVYRVVYTQIKATKNTKFGSIWTNWTLHANKPSILSLMNRLIPMQNVLFSNDSVNILSSVSIFQ